MSEFDFDIQSMLDDILQGNDPEIAKLDQPTPLVAEEVLSSKEEEPCDAAIAKTSATEVPESPNTRGTPTEVSEILDAGADNAVEEDGSTSSNSTTEAVRNSVIGAILNQFPEDEEALVVEEVDGDLHACKIEPVDESQWSKAVQVESIQLPEFTSDELMADLDIRNYGTLVSLNTLRWHAKVRDHKAALDASAASGADPEAYEARKRLLVGADEKLKRVHTAIDAARTEHYRMTLPWSTVGVNDHGRRAGSRLLPNTLFFEYTKKMGKFKQDMLTALDGFVQAYPTLIAISQKKLGSSFDHSEYPAPSQIRNYFGLNFDFAPIPVGADFDGVTLHQAEKLAMNVNKKTRQMLENAMQDAWKRLADGMAHAHSVLSNPDAKFHFTLVDKMRESASMLAHLNVTKDPRIEAIRARIEKDLAKRDVTEIRKDDALRKHLAAEAQAVITLMKEYVNDSSSKSN